MGRQGFAVAWIEDRHDRLFPGDRNDREPATDDLGDRRQIGFDIHQALRAGVAEAEADHSSKTSSTRVPRVTCHSISR